MRFGPGLLERRSSCLCGNCAVTRAGEPRNSPAANAGPRLERRGVVGYRWSRLQTMNDYESDGQRGSISPGAQFAVMTMTITIPPATMQRGYRW